MLPSSILVSKN